MKMKNTAIFSVLAMLVCSSTASVNADTAPPIPDPLTWAAEPYVDPAWPSYIVGTMTASVASDPSGGVEYYFDCVEAPVGGWWFGCEDSGWQTSTTFSDWLLEDGVTYHYQVKARDGLGNETGWSTEATITPGSDGGNTAPVANDDGVTATINTPISITVLINLAIQSNAIYAA